VSAPVITLLRSGAGGWRLHIQLNSRHGDTGLTVTRQWPRDLITTTHCVPHARQ